MTTRRIAVPSPSSLCAVKISELSGLPETLSQSPDKDKQRNRAR